MQKIKRIAMLLTMAALTITMKTSQAAINKLKVAEGFSATAYRDGANAAGTPMYSIGFGHQIQAHELSLKTKTLTRVEAEKIMRSDLAPLELQINRVVPKGFNQNQFDACISFGYNCGSGALSKILETWTSTHSVDAVTARMKLYTKTTDNDTGQKVTAPVLVKRRTEEANTFASNVMPPLGIIALVGGLSLAYLAFA